VRLIDPWGKRSVPVSGSNGFLQWSIFKFCWQQECCRCFRQCVTNKYCLVWDVWMASHIQGWLWITLRILTADGMQTWLNEDSVRHAGVCCSDRPKMAEVIAKFLLLYHPCFLILPVASSSQSLDTFKQDHISCYCGPALQEAVCSGQNSALCLIKWH
jgi:hypothetical protein